MNKKVKFKCTLSGNIVEFEQEMDIRELRTHPQYVEVFEDGSEAEEKSDMDRPQKKFKVTPQGAAKK